MDGSIDMNDAKFGDKTVRLSVWSSLDRELKSKGSTIIPDNVGRPLAIVKRFRLWRTTINSAVAMAIAAMTPAMVPPIIALLFTRLPPLFVSFDAVEGDNLTGSLMSESLEWNLHRFLVYLLIC